MTPEAQRIAIAEAFGWKRSPDFDVTEMGYGGTIKVEAWLNGMTIIRGRERLPDYLNDLNVIQSAIISMPKSVQELFACRLAELRTAKMKMHHQLTASDWAETILRTIGKWVES